MSRKTEILVELFGLSPEKKEVLLYTLKNQNGMEISISQYGGIITAIRMPDGVDIALGYASLEQYFTDTCFFGALIGRYANRIGGAEFILSGEGYFLNPTSAEGEPVLQLHGGPNGFHTKVWNACPFIENNQPGLRLSCISPDGEEGFPGELKVDVTYLLTNNNELKISYFATTDKATHVNLTNHSYFNLKGQGKGDILDHEISIQADHITPVNRALIPTGELMPVIDTPMDLRHPVRIGERIDSDFEQLKFADGFDHNYVLSPSNAEGAVIARVQEPLSGRYLEVCTDMPGLQFYAGNFLDSRIIGKSGQPYVKRGGFCLETQYFPDSPNQPAFPSTLLLPEERFQSTTVYRFGQRS